MNRGSAAEETFKSIIVRRCTLQVRVNGQDEDRKREMSTFYSQLCLITSLRIEYEGISYAHSPTECSALGKQEDTVYS